MSWALRLEALRAGKGPSCQPSKLPKPPFVSFVSKQDGRFHPESAGTPPAQAELRARLADAADREGVARSLIERMPDAELEGVELLADAGLSAYARMIEADADRIQGRVPRGWNQAATCRRCGPVILWPGAPSDVLGCPWCVPRSRGISLPRPAVTCCQHQQPGSSETGMRACTIGHAPQVAQKAHVCSDWQPLRGLLPYGPEAQP